MSTIVVIDGDELKFNPQFGANTVMPPPRVQISGSGKTSIENKKVCMLSDEKRIAILADYVKPPYMLAGKGILTITLLAPDQVAAFALADVPIIVVGSQFTAQFQPTIPATDPQSKPDTDLSPASGSGRFINSQSFVTAG